MKHYFIINPMAGVKNSEKSLEKTLYRLKYSNNDIEIYHTKGPGDATVIAREICSSVKEPLRIYACGGDGTINEVVNGVAGFDHAALGCLPCGSGNDFVKFFGGAENFSNPESLICGAEYPVDLIQVNDEYCINAGNFGLEAAVILNMAQVKNKGFFSGKKAYAYGIVKSFIRNMKTACRIVADGEVVADGDILLGNFANGSHVGSAFKCAPRAKLDDGFMELCIVKPISRFRFLTLIKRYMNGKHLDDPKCEPFITYRRCSQLEVSSPSEELAYVLDGEVRREKSFTVRVIKDGIRLVLPKNLSGFLKNREEATVM